MFSVGNNASAATAKIGAKTTIAMANAPRDQGFVSESALKLMDFVALTTFMRCHMPELGYTVYKRSYTTLKIYKTTGV